MIKRNILECMTLVGKAPSYYEGAKTYVSTGAVDCDHIDYKQTEQVTYDNRPSRANLSVTSGDILFAKMCGTKKILRINDVMAKYLFSTGFCAVRANESVMIADLLYHLLSSEQFLTQKDQNSSGATQKAITNAGLKKITIQVPDLEEQRVLAAKLDCIEQMTAKRRIQIEYFDQLVKFRFIEMFVATDVASEWSYCTIADVSNDMRTGPFGSALHHDEFVDSGVFVLGIDNAVENKFSYNRMRYITEEKYQQLKRYTVYPGDVIITIMGTVGRSAVIPVDMPKAINTKHLACITPNLEKVNAQFLSCAFQIHPGIRMQLQNQSKGAIMDGLNLTIIKGLSFRIPPIDLQNQFVEFYEQTDKSKLAIQKSLDKLEILKKALMQKYFG